MRRYQTSSADVNPSDCHPRSQGASDQGRGKNQTGNQKENQKGDQKGESGENSEGAQREKQNRLLALSRTATEILKSAFGLQAGDVKLPVPKEPTGESPDLDRYLDEVDAFVAGYMKDNFAGETARLCSPRQGGDPPKTGTTGLPGRKGDSAPRTPEEDAGDFGEPAPRTPEEDAGVSGIPTSGGTLGHR